MAYVEWEIKGAKISVCNCNYGCPCQFYAPPTYDKCEGLEVPTGTLSLLPRPGVQVSGNRKWLRIGALVRESGWRAVPPYGRVPTYDDAMV